MLNHKLKERVLEQERLLDTLSSLFALLEEKTRELERRGDALQNHFSLLFDYLDLKIEPESTSSQKIVKRPARPGENIKISLTSSE